MITQNDFQGIGEVAVHPNLPKLEIAINEAVLFDLSDLFGGFTTDVKNIDTEIRTKPKSQITDYDLKINLLKGGAYIGCSGKEKTHLGVRKIVAYYAYARYSILNSFNDTPVGNVAKSGDFSLPKPLKELELFADKYRNMGLVLAEQTLDFICRNTAVFSIDNYLCEKCKCNDKNKKTTTKGYGLSGFTVSKLKIKS